MEIVKWKSKYGIGVIALLCSAFITAVSQVFYANQVQGIHPFLFTGISFFITAMFFQSIAFRQKQSYNWAQSRRPILLLNGASILAFMGFYYALKYIEPAIVSALEMGIGPLFIVLMMLVQHQTIRKSQWGIAIGTLIACLFLIVAVLTGETGVKLEISSYTIVGLVASLLCGVGAVLCSVYSKQLSELSWTSSMILSKRYIGIIVVSFLFTYDIVVPYFQQNIMWILLVTVFGVMLPMYLLQKGIQYTSVFIVMMSLCFVPVFTFIFQLFDSRISFSYITLIGILLLFILGSSSVIDDARANE